MHKHNFKLKKEFSIFLTNIRDWECECGKTRESFEPWGGDEYTYTNKIGKYKKVNWMNNYKK